MASFSMPASSDRTTATNRSLLLITVLTALLSIAASSLTHAENAPWYQVDLFIFSQNQNNLMAEAWDDELVPTSHKRAISLYGNRAARAGIKLLKTSQRTLPVSKSVMSKRGYQPLFHQAWQQPMLPKKQAIPIKIRGGEQLNDHIFELDGYITLDIARYLHLRTNLFYSLKKPANWQPSSAPETITEDSPIDAQAINGSEPQPNPVTKLSGNTIDADSETLGKDPEILTMLMKQGRRMRRDQLHYLDHPMFGLFIKLTRIEAPTAAVELKPLPAQTTATAAITKNAISPKPIKTPVPVNLEPAALKPTPPSQ